MVTEEVILLAPQNAIKEKYLVTKVEDLMNLISTDDLCTWKGLQNDLDYLTPIYSYQTEFDLISK